MAAAPSRPWEGLDPGIAAVLRPELPALADEIVAAVWEAVPEYARPLEGPFGAGLRTGVEEALRQFLELIERPGGRRGTGREVYVGLGRGEQQAGRPLDALLAAYRLGARVAWRRLAAAGVAAGIEPDTLYLLAEAIFAYIDELSAESAEGYAQEQLAAAGEAERRRRRLVALLVQDPPPDSAAVEAAARDARWELPRTLAALAVDGPERDRVPGRLPAGVLAAPVGDLLCALVPDAAAPGRRAQLERAAAGSLAALGPCRPWPEAGESFARAVAALGLVRDGVLESRSLAVASEHGAALLLHADRRLAGDFARARLVPLDVLPAPARARLAATLLAWLRHQGRLKAVAESLGVHPQTVRYRMTALRERFGAALDDPDARFGLELALRIELGAAPPAEGAGSPGAPAQASTATLT